VSLSHLPPFLQGILVPIQNDEGRQGVICSISEGSAIMKRKNTEDPLFKLHRKNHQHDPDNLDFIEKALFP